ncbi:hypothetical protein Lfu02_45480 [Longispora fulva]|uniref:Uncharacterized protein n=1 Tax=Longispora fulva TaxID=619741 RepID=A0A8J7GT65_9ACTN|nr:hypothetical protein [Longispora fulva]MBG6137923.1 hypothetical protein [Longispora fulva]GIG60176.1 hypothetical protein Lfu02_45480 [Longispora fulva]
MIDHDEIIAISRIVIAADLAKRPTMKEGSTKRGNWLAQAELNVPHGSRYLLPDDKTLSSPEYPPPLGDEVVTSTGELARLRGAA